MKPKLLDFVFVIPLKAEAEPLLLKLKDIQKNSYGSRKIITGLLSGKKVGLIISGCGKIKAASATQLLIDRFPAKYYFHYGTAGAVSPDLNINDVIVATRVIEHDVVELFPEKVPPPVHEVNPKLIQIVKKTNSEVIYGPVLSGNEDVVSTERRSELFATHKGLLVDWESAGFLLTCNLNKVKGLIFRGISDLAYEQTMTEYNKNQKKVVRKIIKILVSVISYFETNKRVKIKTERKS